MASHAVCWCAQETRRASSRGAQGWAAPAPIPLSARVPCHAAPQRTGGCGARGGQACCRRHCKRRCQAQPRGEGVPRQSPPMAGGGGRAVPTLPPPPLGAVPGWLGRRSQAQRRTRPPCGGQRGVGATGRRQGARRASRVRRAGGQARHAVQRLAGWFWWPACWHLGSAVPAGSGRRPRRWRCWRGPHQDPHLGALRLARLCSRLAGRLGPSSRRGPAGEGGPTG